MTHVPLGAHVACRDGAAGESIGLIVDPDTLQVTHFIVKERARPHPERLVPIDEVTESTHDNVRLNCTLAELSEMQLFVITEHRLALMSHFTSRFPSYVVRQLDEFVSHCFDGPSV